MMFDPDPPSDWFARFVDELEALAAGLPPGVRRTFRRGRGRLDWFELDVRPPTPAHRRLMLDGDENNLDYSLGDVWTELIEPSPAVVTDLLAVCDAVKLGRVCEVRDRRTGLLHHIYRLKTRGQDRYLRDRQYSWPWQGGRVRKVRSHRLPGLEAAA